MANWASKETLGDPSDPEWAARNLTWIEPIRGQRWRVYQPAAAVFEGLIRELAAAGYKPTSSGGYNYRNIRGSDKLSQHAFGTAIDINAATNALGSRITDMPRAGEIARRFGIEWGGSWKDRPDPMHFEFTGRTNGAGAESAPSAGSVALPQTEAATGPVQPSPYSPLEQLASFARDPLSGFSDRSNQQMNQSWLENSDFGAKSILNDVFAGNNPLKRFAYQGLSNIFGIGV